MNPRWDNPGEDRVPEDQLISFINDGPIELDPETRSHLDQMAGLASSLRMAMFSLLGVPVSFLRAHFVLSDDQGNPLYSFPLLEQPHPSVLPADWRLIHGATAQLIQDSFDPEDTPELPDDLS